MSTTKPNVNRRDFFKKVFIYTSAGAMIQVLARKVAQAEPQLIDLTGKSANPDNKECLTMAVGADGKSGIHYVADLDKALAAKDKLTIRKKGETCDTCALYDFQKNGKSTCALLPKCLVHPKGSCNSWSKKA